MTVSIVVAMGDNGVIGLDGAMPWHLPEDLKHFKRVTLGHPMIMGRKTYESIGRPLPGRTTIVVTRQASWSAEGVVVALSLDAAVGIARQLDTDVFIVGGGEIYAHALASGLVDELIVSWVPGAPDGDTYFPRIDWDGWVEASREPAEGFAVATYRRP
ncbi:MAG: diacylglycerol kinase [Nocardioidaceae bacterium]|nr:diacylglycerol kinase [Nocardioidaceae bacterium]